MVGGVDVWSRILRTMIGAPGMQKVNTLRYSTTSISAERKWILVLHISDMSVTDILVLRVGVAAEKVFDHTLTTLSV